MIIGDSISRYGQTVGKAFHGQRAADELPICISIHTLPALELTPSLTSSPSPSPRPSMPITSIHRAVEHRHGVAIDYMAGRHFVTSPPSHCLPLPLIPGPVRFGFAATLPKMHPPTLARSTQATPVHTKVTARPCPRPITPAVHSRVPEHQTPGVRLSRRAAACV